MKQFIVAVEEAFEPEETEEVKGSVIELLDRRKNADGEVTEKVVPIRFFRPREGQVALLMAQTGRHASNDLKVSAVINFFTGVLDDPSYQYVTSRLMDQKDEFGLTHIEGLLQLMMEEWSGNPTQSSSGSTESPNSDGQNSTPTTPTLISSGSPSTGS